MSKGNLGTTGGGKPAPKPIPMKPPVGPLRPGKSTNHGKAGTQNCGK